MSNTADFSMLRAKIEYTDRYTYQVYDDVNDGKKDVSISKGKIIKFTASAKLLVENVNGQNSTYTTDFLEPHKYHNNVQIGGLTFDIPCQIKTAWHWIGLNGLVNNLSDHFNIYVESPNTGDDDYSIIVECLSSPEEMGVNTGDEVLRIYLPFGISYGDTTCISNPTSSGDLEITLKAYIARRR
jgi:hypothetical protein